MTTSTSAGLAMFELIERLYPLPRSITGDGVRATLDAIGELIPLERHEVPSGTPVLDWTVPREWNVREAWLKDPDGRVVADFAQCNLHLVGGSVPMHRTLPLQELQSHLHSLPEEPDLVPWRSSYYVEDWGFCLADRVRQALPDGNYEVYIETTLEDGHLSYAECILPGETQEEVLVSAHTCHPSLANDNLSGIAVATYAARALTQRPVRRYTYRFLFAPGTIGALTWLALNRGQAGRIRHGLTLSCLGDGRPFTYKRTFGGDAEIDRAARYLFEQRGEKDESIAYFPYGYDERQYNSPGFRLPVGALVRARHGTFPEYHTSGDNLSFISAEHLDESLRVVLELFEILEANQKYVSRNPHGEPQLGRRGLFEAMGGHRERATIELALLWVLACADGEHDLLSITERSGIGYDVIREAADLLVQHAVIAGTEGQPSLPAK
jgi:aminopeptidase-like protein